MHDFKFFILTLTLDESSLFKGNPHRHPLNTLYLRLLCTPTHKQQVELWKLWLTNSLTIFMLQPLKIWHSDLPSAIIKMDDKSLISKLFKRLIMVTIHVSCVGMQENNFSQVWNIKEKAHKCDHVCATPAHYVILQYFAHYWPLK